MNTGPPFQNSQESDKESKSWEEFTDIATRLDYPNREIYTFHIGWQSDRDLPLLADLDPQPHDPDPEIWPIQGVDPGHVDSVEELIQQFSTYPVPHVKWVTPEYLKQTRGFYPDRRQLNKSKVVEDHLELKRKKRRDEIKQKKLEHGVNQNTAAAEAQRESYAVYDEFEERKERMEQEVEYRLRLTEDRRTALTRIAKMWNGKQVRGHHLLVDKCPKWRDFLDDLDQDELKPLLVDENVDPDVYEAFKHHEWYNTEAKTYLKPQHVAQKKIYWNPNQRGKTLLNKHEDFPGLVGDQFERLRHRFTVGMVALWFALETNRELVLTYPPFTGFEKEFRADVGLKRNESEFYDGNIIGCEVITHHNDRKNWNNTLKKIYQLDAANETTPIIVGPNRSTVYDLFRYWEDNGHISFPGTGFNTDWNIQKGRSKVQEAYEQSERWPIADWTTGVSLWRSIFRDGNPEAEETALSMSW
jgi:hypothetical protein